MPTTNAYVAGTQAYTPSSSQFYQLVGASISGSGLNIQSLDINASDFTVLQLDHASSVSVTQSGVAGISVTSAGATIDIFSNASSISSASVGIDATENGSGDIQIVSFGAINSSSTGIAADDDASNINVNSFVSVVAAGTIAAGSTAQGSLAASGIWAGYGNGSGSFVSGASGTVIVNNLANITAAEGAGIFAFNSANGNVSVYDEAGASVGGHSYGIEAVAGTSSGDTNGSGDVSIYLGQNAQVSSATTYGLFAENYNATEGNISVVMSAGDTITSAGAGINAVDKAGSLPGGSIFVSSAGTINSGSTITGSEILQRAFWLDISAAAPRHP